MLTGGSRVTFATGMAVMQAAEKAVARAAEARGADLGHLARRRRLGRTARPIPSAPAPATFPPLPPAASIALKSARTGGPIGGRGVSSTRRAPAPASATHICDVEVDPETGHVTILRYTAVQDVGRAIHPSYVEGQIQGGVAQGIGWALNEEYIYDADGQAARTRASSTTACRSRPTCR